MVVRSRVRLSAPQLRAQLAMVLAAFLFGSTFVIVKGAVKDVTPTAYVTFRFAVGTLVLMPFAAWAARRHAPPKGLPSRAQLLRVATLTGAVLGAGYVLQTVGLQYTSTSSSAFITGLFVVFTPLIAVALRHRSLGITTTIAVLVAALGLFLLTGAGFAFGRGELLTLGCAFAYAVHIVILSTVAVRFRPLTFNVAQMAALVVLTAPLVLVTGVGRLSGRAVFGIVFTGVATSALSFSLQVFGQRRLTPTRSALLLSLEPVFAGIIGYGVGERLGVLGLTGATLILVAIVIEEGGLPGLPRRLPRPASVDRSERRRGR